MKSRIANAWRANHATCVSVRQEHELAYKGVIDDNYKSAAEVKAYAKDAVASIASGQKVAVEETKPLGCSIKRKTD